MSAVSEVAAGAPPVARATPRAASIRRARRRRLRRAVWNVVGLGVFLVLVFPVFWMISTAFKPDTEIHSSSPTWFSIHPTLQHFRDAMAAPAKLPEFQGNVAAILAETYPLQK